MRALRSQMMAAVRMLVVLTVSLGVVYPLAVTAVAQTTMSTKADGSLVEYRGRVVGSRLIGQKFTGDAYFHSRPSAAGDGYDALASGGANLGPSSSDLLAAVEERSKRFRETNGLPLDAAVPVDAVTASGSGLDPHISIANAKLQAARVAVSRQMKVERVLELVAASTDRRSLGFLGQPGVNVMLLNLSLDRAAG